MNRREFILLRTQTNCNDPKWFEGLGSRLDNNDVKSINLPLLAPVYTCDVATMQDTQQIATQGKQCFDT